MIRTIWLTLLISIVLALSTAVSAQPAADDLLVMDTQQPVLLQAKRGSTTPSTLTMLPGFTSYGPLIAGPGDGSALLLGMAQTAVPRTYLYQADVTGLSTLSTFLYFPMYAADMGLDDDGDLLVLTRWNGKQNGIYHAPLVGATTLYPVTSWPSSAAETVAFAEKLDTGDWWTLDMAGALRLVDRQNGAVLTLVKTGGFITSLRTGDVLEDPVTGDVLVARGNDLLGFSPGSGAITTVVKLGVPQGGSEALGLHFDEISRGFLFTAWMGFGPGMYGYVHELDAALTTITRSTALGTPRNPENVVSAWGRGITAGSSPTLGTRYTLKLLSNPDVGQAYQAALSFSPRPGIPTPAGTIPLTPDPLFYLSLSGAPYFVNFAGTLGIQGDALIHVDLPNATGLRGVRMILAAVVYDTGGIRRILGPQGFTVR